VRQPYGCGFSSAWKRLAVFFPACNGGGVGVGCAATRNMSQTLNKKQMDAILHSDLHDAFGVLGAHVITLRGQKQVAVRAFLRDAKEVVAAEMDGERREWPMTRVHEHGLFELLLPDRQQLFRMSCASRVSAAGSA